LVSTSRIFIGLLFCFYVWYEAKAVGSKRVIELWWSLTVGPRVQQLSQAGG